jgi:outer membrane protein
MHMPSWSAALALFLLSVPLAHAAEHEGADRGEDEPDGYRWGLGVGVGFKKGPYAGVDSKTTVLPLVSFENRYVRLYGNKLDAKLPSWGPVDFSLRTQVSIGEGYKGSDSAQLAGMADRKGAIFVGATSTWRNAIANVSVSWLKDVSGHSKGSVASLDAEHGFRVAERFEITPHVEFARYDAKFVDYYYGVRADESTASRPAYLGKSSSEVRAGLRFGYLVTPHQRLLLDVSDGRLGAAITDSPVVDRKSVAEVRLGYLYAF